MDAQDTGEHDLTLAETVHAIVAAVQDVDWARGPDEKVTGLLMEYRLKVLVQAMPNLVNVLNTIAVADATQQGDYGRASRDALDAVSLRVFGMRWPVSGIQPTAPPVTEQVMPPHGEDADQWDSGTTEPGRLCKGAMTPGYVQEIGDGQIHCNVCGWVTTRG